MPTILASKIILGPARLIEEGLGLTRDFVIISEGIVSWLMALTLGGGPGSSASEVASDPFGSAWDEVVRSPRRLGGLSSETFSATGNSQPAA